MTDLEKHVSKPGRDKLVKEVRQKTGKAPVLVLDNLRSLSNYKENDSDDWRPIGVWLKNLRALDVVTIVIDHHGKGENAGPRGSSSKTDWANVSIFIKSVILLGPILKLFFVLVIFECVFRFLT